MRLLHRTRAPSSGSFDGTGTAAREFYGKERRNSAGVTPANLLNTRLGAAIAMVLFLNYMFAKGRWFLSPDSEDAAVFFSALVVTLGAAGRALGVDVFLARRWPRALLW